jgi:hypothetical protein
MQQTTEYSVFKVSRRKCRSIEIMRKSIFVLLIALAIVGVICSSAPAANGRVELSEEELRSLEACNAVIELFQTYQDSIWPGFNLAERPFMFYMPDKWALLFNYPGAPEGFTAHPADWPRFNTKVLYHEGQYGNLAGQLSFGVPIDTIKVAAVAFIDRPAADIFAHIVHENFHQYQHYGINPAFGDIPWAREEKYPIENVENTALAFMEMRLLMDALSASETGNENDCLRNVKQFVAIRSYRWNNLESFIGRYEQGQEINEGTAEYVEKKALSLMANLPNEELATFSLVEHFFNEFKVRTTGKSISPEDMPRNRIYFVGSAQGFLADHLGISWKKSAQRAGEDFSFMALFREKLALEEGVLDTLVKNAMSTDDYSEILAATENLIAEYHAGFEKELAKFESQNGFRMEIALRTSGVRRSRSSSAKKWLIGNGGRELRNHYRIYSLTDNDLLLQVHESGLLEQNNWDDRTRTVSFFVPDIGSIVLDSIPQAPVEGKGMQFQTLKVEADNMKFETSRPGTSHWNGNRLRVNLIP